MDRTLSLMLSPTLLNGFTGSGSSHESYSLRKMKFQSKARQGAEISFWKSQSPARGSAVPPGLVQHQTSPPKVEILGYCRVSLRDRNKAKWTFPKLICAS